jgi:hypothetical protein
MTHYHTICGVLAGALVAAAAGCDGRDPDLPRLVPVAGTVTLDRDPLSGAMVTFVPCGGTRGRGATGYTDEQGRYQLRAPDGHLGVPVGEYRVIVTKLVMPDGSDFPIDSGIAPIDSPARQILPSRYSDERQTILTATVPDDGGTFDFPLVSDRGTTVQGCE